MKRLFYLMSFILCIGFLYACTQTEETGILNSWDYIITCGEKTAEDHYVITYSNEKIISSTGILTFENRNDFGVAVYIQKGDDQIVELIEASDKIILYEMEQGVEYTLGCHAEVAEGTEIKLLVHDGSMNLVESVPLFRKPISAQSAIKIAQNYLGETYAKVVTNYDSPKIVGILGNENLFMLAPNSPNWVKQNKIIGRELYEISFFAEDADVGPAILYVDKYKGKLLGAGITM